MKQILWFRRDLRIDDNAILSNAKNEVLPIFIFDKSILSKLSVDDKRVSFIYNSVLKLKVILKTIGLDLAIFYGKPFEIIKNLKKDFDEVLCSVDFDEYSIKRDKEIEELIPMKRYIDSFIINPNEHLNSNNRPYRVFTPFYKSLNVITQSKRIDTFKRNKNLKKITFDYNVIPTLMQMNFKEQKLPIFLKKNAFTLLEEFGNKITSYKEDRDYFYKDASSNISVHLRFGLVSPKQIFNYVKSLNTKSSEFFIRELFWREFYNYILFHFPKSQNQNFNGLNIKWNENDLDFEKWCNGETGIPIIDAAMINLNNTGFMHNRLRMVVASFLTKNLFIDWKKGEFYFSKKLLDYEASSNIGSWQWSSSTGADATPYFRTFNPYIQSRKFDKEGYFIKSIIKEFSNIDSRLLHIENGVQSNLFNNYTNSIVDIKISRQRAIKKFKEAKNA
ncbi:MAG: deoxyribodipyrimidine photo-lyase [Arcobacter sp.]|nr:deoxyribodipyrimidine photo-lyase [Arcobacter sp.]